MFWLGLALGVLLGGTAGTLIVALCRAAKEG